MEITILGEGAPPCTVLLHIKKLNFRIIIMSNMACMSGLEPCLVVHSIICTLDWPRTALRWSWWDDGDSLLCFVINHAKLLREEMEIVCLSVEQDRGQ